MKAGIHTFCRLCYVAAVSFTVVAWVTTGTARADELSIAVDAAQNVTMSGSSSSLRDAIVELCDLANVDLLAYDAQDRPFAASYQDLPLPQVLSRLLRSEVFLVGLRAGESANNSVVSWLRVSGASGGTGGGPLRVGPAVPTSPSGTVAGIDIGVAADVVDTALTSDDTIARSTARRTILQNLRANPAALQRLLASDPAAVVDQLIGARHAAELLNSLQSVASDVKDRTQIQTILRGLRLRQEAERRQAAGQ